MSNENDPMAARWGTALIVTGPIGTSRMMHHPDGTISGVHATGAQIVGIWEAVGNDLYETFSAPPESAVKGRHIGGVVRTDKRIGDKWKTVLPNGDVFKLEVVKA